MTDHERLIALLDEWGVIHDDYNSGDDLHIDVTADLGPKQGGYRGFVTTFAFTADGEFTTMGAWE